AGGQGRRAVAQRHVPGRARQRPPGPGPHLGEDAHALHPHPARGPRAGGADAVRPDQGPHHLPLQV
ncbi:MAG: Translation initiation factor 1, partial [uncultured Acidimicrobiales bacterium]